MKLIPVLGALAAIGMAQDAGAAGNTPINTPARAARSAFYALYMPNMLSQAANDFDYWPRVFVERGFDQLEAATTVQALLAAPRGIVVPCAQGGSLAARMSRGVPRIVRFLWSDCQLTDDFGPYTLSGPVEVTMIEASFSPKTLYGLRFGNATSDFVEARPRRPGQTYGEYEIHRNLRYTGYIPQRSFDWEDIPGRYTYEVDGFQQQTQMLPDRNPGVPPSVELYPWVTTSYADHILVSRDRTSGYDENQVWSYHEDLALAWGLLGYQYDIPQRPNKPAISETDEFRFSGLRVQNFLGGPVGGPGSGWEFDGKLEVVRNDSFFPGCPFPGTFTYRTVLRPTTPTDLSIGFAYEKGEIEVNESTRLTFTGLPWPDQNPFNARSQLDITSRGLAPMSFIVDGFFAGDLRTAGACN